MKKLIVLFAIYICNTSIKAQFTITLNGKKVIANQEFNYSDLKNLTISFSNPQKLPTYSDGYIRLSCSFFDESGVKKNAKYVSKRIEGAASINSFLNQKVPKTYSLYPKSEEPELFHYLYDYSGNPKEQFSDICESYKSSPVGGKVKLKFEMAYYELTGWHYGSDNFTKFNDYGEAVELIEPFEMFLTIADKNALINCPPINAKFKLNDLMTGYKGIDSTYTWNIALGFIGENGKALKKTSFDFKDYYIQIANVKYNNSLTQDENLNLFKTESDKCVKLVSNLCYQGVHIMWSKANEAKKNKEKGDLLAFGYLEFLGLSTSGPTYIEKFDKKANTNYENETLWESFTIGTISGLKCVSIIKAKNCNTGYSEDVDGCATYIFKNPNNPKTLLVIKYFRNSSGYIKLTPDQLKEMASKVEKFISILNFTK
ncbi:MAG: hypothetical protein SFY56_12550 [Bacteroidota bacterium]|nr:hypothetical protein [Bacteroidota bacterium]